MAVQICLIICASLVLICLIFSIESIVTNDCHRVFKTDFVEISVKLDSLTELLQEVKNEHNKF